MISHDIRQCLEDMHQAAEHGKISLDAQVRAYDLLERILELTEAGVVCKSEDFCSEYESIAESLESAYDQTALLSEVAYRLKSYEMLLEEAQASCHKSAALHECAKETYEIWQTKGFIARWSALNRLRTMAGFRLESHRIGNYVAKTFDLMNEAATAHAKAQQSKFAADVTYKIKPGLYSCLAAVLR